MLTARGCVARLAPARFHRRMTHAGGIDISRSAPTILLLAAGRSTRMGGEDKLLRSLGDGPLLRVVAERCMRAGPTRVVLGPGQGDRRGALDGLAVEIVEAPDGAGMSASIATGVAGLDGPVLIVLADMPAVTAHDLHLLLALSAQAPGAILRAAAEDGTPGHPVLFPADLLDALSGLRGDRGARDILAAQAARVHLVPLRGRRALIDLDTPEDWAAWEAANDQGRPPS